MDLSPLIEPLQAALYAAVLGAIPVGLTLVMRKLGLDANDKLRTQLESVLEDAAGLAYKRITDEIAKGHLDNVTIRNAAMAAALQFALDEVPKVIVKFGLGPDQVQQRVEAKLGKILGLDPTTSLQIGVPPQAVPAGAAAGPVAVHAIGDKEGPKE